MPDDDIIDFRNLVRDYYYFKELQSAIVLKLNAELKVSFPAYLNVFSKITTQTSLKLLHTYPLTTDILAAKKDDILQLIRSTARFAENQKHLDSILSELHKAVDKLQGQPVYERICILQTLRDVGFLSAAVLIAEMGSFDLFPSPKKLSLTLAWTPV